MRSSSSAGATRDEGSNESATRANTSRPGQRYLKMIHCNTQLAIQNVISESLWRISVTLLRTIYSAFQTLKWRNRTRIREEMREILKFHLSWLCSWFAYQSLKFHNRMKGCEVSMWRKNRNRTSHRNWRLIKNHNLKTKHVENMEPFKAHNMQKESGVIIRFRISMRSTSPFFFQFLFKTISF